MVFLSLSPVHQVKCKLLLIIILVSFLLMNYFTSFSPYFVISNNTIFCYYHYIIYFDKDCLTLNVLNFLHSPKIDTDSLFIVYPIKTDIFPGELNNTFQTNVMFSASKEGQHKICTHVVHNGYVNDSCFLYSKEYMKKNYF